MAVRLPRCLLRKNGVLQPARWAAERRFVSYPGKLHKFRCKAPAVTEEH